MKKTLSRLFRAPWYPIAISAYPVLALLSANAGQVRLEAGMRPLLISVGLGILIYVLLWLYFKRIYKAAFLATLFLTLFFSYGHVLIFIEARWAHLNAALWLPAVWLLLFLLSFFWASRPYLAFISSTPSLNVIALVLLIPSLWQIHFNRVPESDHRVAADHAPIQENLSLPENPPDVYFIVLDSYGRSDLLYSAYGFDNRYFENELKRRGFYIASCSQSNYVRTELSIASALNMQYLQNLDDDFVPQNIRRAVLWDSLQHSAVRYNFESLGYETVNFASGYAWLELTDADHFLTPPPLSSGMTEFEALFLRTTLARYIQDWGWVDPDYLLGERERERFNYIFDNMDDIARMPQHTFAYIHIISPHPPFVFDAQGNPTYPPDFWNEQRLYPPDLYQKGYVNQLQYLNTRLLQAVDVLLETSKTPPIIILLGDHGPWHQPRSKRLLNFTAVYFPEHSDTLYPTVTPVNLFRLVFNTYFGGKYDILKDVAYFSPVPNLYDFTKIENSCSLAEE